MSQYIRRVVASVGLAAIPFVGSSSLVLHAPAATPDAPALSVEVAGCETMCAGPVCEMAEQGTLRIWARSEPNTDFALDLEEMPGSVARSAPAEELPARCPWPAGVAGSIPGQPVQGGHVWTFSPPKNVVGVVVTATRNGARTQSFLPLRPAVPMPEIAVAEALKKEGKLAEAEAALDRLADAAGEPARAAIQGLRGRIRFQQGSIDAAIGMLRQAAALRRDAGRLSAAMGDELVLAYVYMYSGRRFAEARQALARAEDLVRQMPAGQTDLAYHAGLLAYETGDWRAALRHLRFAYESSQHLGLDQYRASALPIQAFMLQMLGRDAEGEAMLLEAERAAQGADLCVRADVWANQGWFRIGSHNGKANAGDALQKALTAYRTTCENASAIASVLTDFSVLALQEGHADQARGWLEQAKQADAQADPRVRVWWHDIEGQIALQQGRPADGLRIYDALADLAAVKQLPVARFHAELGRAHALDALGREREAGAAYENAEGMLWEFSLLVPAGEGRDGFLENFDDSARAAIRFFVQRDPARAATIARQARARSLATLRWIERLSSLSGDQRAAWDRAIEAYRQGREALEGAVEEYWKLPKAELEMKKALQRGQEQELLRQLDTAIASLWQDAPKPPRALPPPSKGELILVYRQLDQGWAGFAIERERTVAKSLGDVDPSAEPSELARELLLPFREELSRARRVRFLPSGALESLDFQVLPWQGRPLVAALPVEYGVDAGEHVPTPQGATNGKAPPRAVVVSDPRGGLPGAQKVGRAVADVLEGAGWQVVRLFGSEATHRAVEDALKGEAADLFHYSGHGRFAGRGGWESALLLSEGSELEVGDVLALPRAPRWIVLAACEGAAAHGAGDVEGLGLAQAFLLAGSAAVLASTRPVGDAAAVSLMEAFYGGIDGGRLGGFDRSLADPMAERLRRASLALMERAPDAVWSSFRVLVP